MNETPTRPLSLIQGDVLLREMWRIKDARSAARDHDVHRLFAEARERQESSSHRVANLQERATTEGTAR